MKKKVASLAGVAADESVVEKGEMALILLVRK